MNQETLDTAVDIATRMALAGTPVRRVLWVPAGAATEDPRGVFAVQIAGPLSASETPPWEAR